MACVMPSDETIQNGLIAQFGAPPSPFDWQTLAARGVALFGLIYGRVPTSAEWHWIVAAAQSYGGPMPTDAEIRTGLITHFGQPAAPPLAPVAFGQPALLDRLRTSFAAHPIWWLGGGAAGVAALVAASNPKKRK